MMKRRSHIALLFAAGLLLWAACGHSATVTPASATNYYFSTPLRPAHIRGIVMGSPPAYYVPRSEDWDWLAEACEERNALASSWSTNDWSSALVPEFGSWGLAATNGLYKWVTAVSAADVTNVVIRYTLVTNSPPSRGAGAHIYEKSIPSIYAAENWLDGSASLLSGSRGVMSASLNQVYTNVTYSQSYSNIVTNAFSLITMPMTNGTVSVHTNSWTASVTVPGELQAVSNVYGAALVDFCLADTPRHFPRAFDDVPVLPALTALPMQDVFSNYYARLRLTVRLCETVQPVHSGKYQALEEYYYSDGSSYSSTVESDDYFYLDHDVGSNFRRYAKPYDAVLTTRFPSALVTLGGAERVTVAAAYRVGNLYYSRDAYTNISATVFSRISLPEHLTVTGLYATVSVRQDALAQATADFAAAGNGIPNLPAFDSVSAQYREIFSYGAPRYVLIFRIHPTSKFSDW